MNFASSSHAGPSRLPMTPQQIEPLRRSVMKRRQMRLRLAAPTVLLSLALTSAVANPTSFTQAVMKLDDRLPSRMTPSASLYARDEPTVTSAEPLNTATADNDSGVPVYLIIIIGSLVATAVILAVIMCLCRYSRRGYFFKGKRTKDQRRSSWNVESLNAGLPYRMNTDSSSTLDEKSFHGFYREGGVAPFGHHQPQQHPQQLWFNHDSYQGQDVYRPQSQYSAQHHDAHSTYGGAFSREVSRLSTTTASSYAKQDVEKRQSEQQPRSLFGSRDDASRNSSKSSKGACTPPPARRPSFLERALARPMSGQSSHGNSGIAQRVFSDSSSAPQAMPWTAQYAAEQVALPSPIVEQEQYNEVAAIARPVPQHAQPLREVRRTPSGNIFSALGAPLNAWRKSSQPSSSQTRRTSGSRSFPRRAWNSFHQSGPSPRLFSIESDFEGTIGGRDGELPMAYPARGRRPLCEDSVIAPPCDVFPRVASTPQMPIVHSSADLYADLMSGDKRMPANAAGLLVSSRSFSDSTPRCARRDPQSGYLFRSHTRNRSLSAQQILDERVLEELKRRQLREDNNESSYDRRSKRTAKISSWVNANEMCHAGSPPSVLSRNDSISSIALTTSEFISVSRQASLIHRNMLRRLQMLPRPVKVMDAQVGQAFAPEALHNALQRQQDMRMMESPLQPPPRISSIQDAPASLSGICEEHGGSHGLTVCDEAGESQYIGHEEGHGASVAAAMSHATMVPDKASSEVTVVRDENSNLRKPRDVWLAEHVRAEDDRKRLIMEQRRRSKLAFAQTDSPVPSPVVENDDQSVYSAVSPKTTDDKRCSAMQQLLQHMALDETPAEPAQLRRKSTLMAILRSDSMNRSLTEFKAPVLSRGPTQDLLQSDAPAAVQRTNSAAMRCVSMPPAAKSQDATHDAVASSAVQGQTPHPRVQAMLDRARRASASALTLPAGVRLEHLKELAAEEETEQAGSDEELSYIEPKHMQQAKENRRNSDSTSSDDSAHSSLSSGHVSGPRPMPVSQPRHRSVSERLHALPMQCGVSRASQTSSTTFRYSHLLY